MLTYMDLRKDMIYTTRTNAIFLSLYRHNQVLPFLIFAL